jgi:DNA-binding NtrC family response regulator
VGFRLVGASEGRAIDLPLTRQQMTIGAGEGCDLVLDHDSVSRRHAQLVVHPDEVEVVDLGSRNGTFVGAGRILSARITSGDEVAFGSVHLRLEESAEGDLRTGITVRPAPPETGARRGRRRSTQGLMPVDSLTTERLPGLLELVAGHASVTAVAQATGAAILATTPVLGVSISCEHGETPATLYHGDKNLDSTEPCQPVLVRRGGYCVALQPPHAAMSTALGAIAEVSALLVAIAAAAIVDETGRRQRQAPPLPVPESTDAQVLGIYRDAAIIAEGDVGVLICGESGTGKEVLARYIHSASARAGGSFVALNCAALPRDLLEAELFGIERGVATGVDERPGKFELADGGTLFLDEIGDMDIGTQASILRVLQEGEVYRVGGHQPRRADVRVISASNREIGDLLARGQFREDLYYRIAAWEVTVPPLRERKGDIANLAAHFLDRAARRRGVRIAGISETAIEMLVEYGWPGNIRQLQKEMDRAALFVSDGGTLNSTHLTAKIAAEVSGRTRLGLDQRVEGFVRGEIVAALQMAGGDVSRTAAALGLSRSTLYRRIKELGIDPAR